MACGFLKHECVIMQKEKCCTFIVGVRSILYLPASFIHCLLSDNPLSVISGWALFRLTLCWIVLLCYRIVRIILRALYLLSSLKSYWHSALSSVRRDWGGKGAELNTLDFVVFSAYIWRDWISLDLLWAHVRGHDLGEFWKSFSVIRFETPTERKTKLLMTQQRHITASKDGIYFGKETV